MNHYWSAWRQNQDEQLARDHRAQTPPPEKDDEYLRLTVAGEMYKAMKMVVRETWVEEDGA